MIVIPAIDLSGGRVVRLEQGRRDRMTVYDADPTRVVRGFVDQGARRVHVVDLDGAFAGRRAAAELLESICRAAEPAQVQVGGGLRTIHDVEACLDGGARWVVLGTAVLRSPELLGAACARWPGRVVVAVDARDGRVAVAGWTEQTESSAPEVAAWAAGQGAAAVLYTDIARDGLRTGPAVEATAQLARALAPVPVIASGGVAGLHDLRALAAAGVPLCVVGRALYEGAFTVAQALAAGGGG